MNAKSFSVKSEDVTLEGLAFVYEGQRLVRVENRSQGVNEDHVYGYDDAYRTASEVQGPRGTVRWEYDVRDQVSRMSIDSGPTTDYTYYPDGSMNTIAWSLVSGEFKYRYTEAGQYETVTFPNGQTRNYSYDWAGRLLQLANLHPTAGNLATYSYEYDLDWATGQKTRKGQRTGMTADVPAQGFLGALTKYYYDVHYQLTGADYPAATPFNGKVARWTYDAIGNRTSETVNGVTANYTYQKVGGNPKNWQRLVATPTTSFYYDPRGGISRLVDQSSEFFFAHDIEGGLTQVSGASTMSAAFDYQGRRVSRVVSGSAENQLYVASDAVSVAGSASESWLFDLGVDSPLAVLKAGSFQAIVIDGLGSAAVAVDMAGTAVSSTFVDAWGVRRGGSGAARYDFTARERDLPWLLYFRSRYYHPSLGRFLEEDPLRFSQSPNFYPYVDNGPLMATDPYGEALEYCTRPLSGIVGAGASTKSIRRHVVLYSTLAKTGCGLGPARPAPLSSLFGKAVPGKWEIESPYDAHGVLKTGYECKTISADPKLESCALSQCSGKAPDYNVSGKDGGINCYDWAESAVSNCEKKLGLTRGTP